MNHRAGWFGRHRILTTVLGVLLVFWTIGVAVGEEDTSDRAPRGGPSGLGSAGEASGTKEERKQRNRGRGREQRDRPAKPRPSKTPEQTPAPRPPEQHGTFLVTRVVDGDTLELGNGQTVRLVGIDTPEAGECGYEAASDALSSLVLGQQVRLTVAGENRDQYGRLLRYVDVGTMDAGLRLIKRGLAIARYDSRDGYGYHPREGFYVEADRSSKGSACVQPKPVPLVGRSAGTGGGGGNCAIGYTPCIPPYPPDLDCGDLDGPIRVSGSDPHGLDADGDGVACES